MCTESSLVLGAPIVLFLVLFLFLVVCLFFAIKILLVGWGVRLAVTSTGFSSRDLSSIPSVNSYSLVENKTITTKREPNLQQVLLNTSQGDGQWPGSHPGFPENGTKLL